MATIPNPDGLSFEFWAAQVYDTFPATIPLPMPESEWRRFAYAMVGAFQVTGWTIPVPDLFKDWQAWVREVLLTYPNKGL